jgi:hypothetical protein
MPSRIRLGFALQYFVVLNDPADPTEDLAGRNPRLFQDVSGAENRTSTVRRL